MQLPGELQISVNTVVHIIRNNYYHIELSCANTTSNVIGSCGALLGHSEAPAPPHCILAGRVVSGARSGLL